MVHDDGGMHTIVHGGHEDTYGAGAPITSLADAVLFASDTEARAVVNLGGFECES